MFPSLARPASLKVCFAHSTGSLKVLEYWGQLLSCSSRAEEPRPGKNSESPQGGEARGKQEGTRKFGEPPPNGECLNRISYGTERDGPLANPKTGAVQNMSKNK